MVRCLLKERTCVLNSFRLVSLRIECECLDLGLAIGLRSWFRNSIAERDEVRKGFFIQQVEHVVIYLQTKQEDKVQIKLSEEQYFSLNHRRARHRHRRPDEAQLVR